jgi:hypothetical protein
MSNRNPALTGLAVATLAFAAACSEVPPTEPIAATPESADLFRGRAPDIRNFDRSLDHEFVRIARDIPGFGGFYYDAAGQLNIVMASLPHALPQAEVRNRLAPRLAAMGQSSAAARGAVIREGRYDFVQLNAMHERARAVLGLKGTVFTDADEVRNRLVIGVEDAAAAASVQKAVSMLGLAAEAVIIEITSPITPESNHTLRDRWRPVAGGLQINFTRGDPPAGSFCTHGFNVRSPQAPNVQGFVTNSHCSDTRGVVVPTPYWQHSRFAENTFIGWEEHDLPFFTGAPCPDNRVCRWSDALGARYEGGVDNAFGAIYRTLWAGSGLNAGSLDVDPANPRWQIVGEIPFPTVGQVLHKTGRTNGWTTGPVNTTCQNVNTSPNVTLFCQDRVTTWSSGGDSGSPYYVRVGETNNVQLIGIHWGSDGAGNTVMSAMNNIRCENEGPAPWITFPGQAPPSTPMCAR